MMLGLLAVGQAASGSSLAPSGCPGVCQRWDGVRVRRDRFHAALDLARTVRREGLPILTEAACSQGPCPPPRTERPPKAPQL